jgi:hypothetical protein
MNFIGYNVFPLCLLALSWYMMTFDIEGWGWVIAAAIFLAVYPSSKNSKD